MGAEQLYFLVEWSLSKSNTWTTIPDYTVEKGVLIILSGWNKKKNQN